MLESDLLALLRSKNLPVRSKPGKSAYVNCPFCPNGDTKFHGRAYWQWQRFRCYRCGTKDSLFAFLKASSSITWEEFRRFAEVGEDAEMTVADQIRRRLAAPDRPDVGRLRATVPPGRLITAELVAQEPLLQSFLLRRNLTIADCTELGALFGGNCGEYAHRFVMPIFDRAGRTVSFQARDMTGLQRRKYMSMEGVGLDRLLYWTDMVARDDFVRVYVVEGVFDAHRLSVNAVATFTKSMTSAQRAMLAEEDDINELVLCWDADAYAQSIAEARRLAPLFPRVGVVSLPEGNDPDSLGGDAVRALPVLWV
jgi:hypothetical protein